MKTNWSTLIAQEVFERGETLIACTLTDEEMLIEFDDCHDDSEVKPFTAWSENYVYFPAVYNDAEWVESVPRNPCDEDVEHMGWE